MSDNQPKVLSPLVVPLLGRTLIEASAGTGKTYTLSILYLRLLLGIGEHNYSRPLTVDEILVVTFTKAATEELRYRIRENIHQLRIACIRGSHRDPVYQKLLSLIKDKQYAIQTLLFAEQQMDEAAIYTIHSFCQRILTTHAFESGILFEQKLVKDENPLKQQVAEDFWRRYFYPLSEELAGVVQQIWRNPEMLLKEITPFLHNKVTADSLLTPGEFSVKISDFHTQAIKSITGIKQQWLQHQSGLAELMDKSDVSKQSYGRFVTGWVEIITDWANMPTIDYLLPEPLIRFSQSRLQEKTKKGVAPEHPLFVAIEQLYSRSFALKNVIFPDILQIISQMLMDEKLQRAEMGYDDLLGQLHHALHYVSGSQLKQMIARRYPVAMIDEFQDTAPIQYQIFDQIYQDKTQTGLLLIGDPKQAIYGFRGADIFTYIQAKSHVDHHFTMEINWRSSQSVVSGINQLFSQHEQPFIFNEIPFIQVRSADKNQQKQFEINEQKIPAVQLCVLPETITSQSDYQQAMAEYTAQEILQWLTAGQQQQAWLIDGENQRRVVTSADIAVLVKTGSEADLIQKALAKYQIRSVYLSNRKSVFESSEAKEILWILQAVLMPENERYLRTALATQLLGSSMTELDSYTSDQSEWEEIVEEFQQYQYYWHHFGILVMLRRLMAKRHIAENLLAQVAGERILTNLMHLGELLQEATVNLDSEHALLRWLSQQIDEPDPNLENQQQRLESDENLVKIITIHKSKGLEYPLVWLPFASHYRESSSKTYHDRATYQSHWQLVPDEETKKLIEEERLAEDLRLLYVALTRSIYHCSVGLAGLKTRKGELTSLHSSALGYLLQQGEACSYADLKSRLTQLADIHTVDIVLQDSELVQLTPEFVTTELSANVFQRHLTSNWQVTSYSGLQSAHSHNQPIFSELLPKFDEDSLEVTTNSDLNDKDTELVSDELTIHRFPKGALVGTALHTIMERIDFTSENLDQPVQQMLDNLHESDEWLPVLTSWLQQVLKSPLNGDGLALNQITGSQKLIELQFYLPIAQTMTAKALDDVCKQYDILSARCTALSFDDVKGMLKGFIDLVFEWQGRFYILDYKSNWLGQSVSDYSPQAVEQAMCEHRYDLQYQLYTLALHRYLKHRLPDYDYQIHFGGVYYLFLRGMDQNYPGHGIFSTRPSMEFVVALDQLFGS
ncbi:exodeoxyribonuclease V subunit beta [Zophobihabitans entericus]|uniref:RecBCD enzyme subunit RecB n=1 Tax=Zophobihabitans entericus TaxID=1635327 RepID=A0A6G9IDT4_9GAMM|nr:exodeoxyribonuclease V subunit beta [Zophobihabitans entericus]